MMKLRSICAVLGTMLVMMTGATVTAYAEDTAPVCGSFDRADEHEIVGWGWDCSLPNTSVPVRVTVTSEETSEVVSEFNPTAAIYREELEADGIGNGTHGFRIQIDWNDKADGSYRIEGWVGEHPFGNSLTYEKVSGTESAEQNSDSSAEDAEQNSAVSEGTGTAPSGDAVSDGAAEAVSSAEEVPVETSANHASSARSLGIFRTTGYCPCRKCSEGWGRRTSTGAIAQSNHTIAVDPRVIPYGSKVMVNGVIYTAEDRGGGVRGNHIDIFFDNHAQTRQHGSRSQEVFLLS